VLDLGVRVRGKRCVDVPRLEWPAVERAVDPLQDHRDHEQGRAVGHGEQAERSQRDRASEQQHWSATDGVGQPSSRQFQRQHDQALHREDQADLCQRQPA
jgi:hypothetical protein